MSSKGFNSVLFDFDSIIDKEISLIKFFAGEYRDFAGLDDFIDRNFITCTDDETLKFKRIYGEEDLFKSILISDLNKSRYTDLIRLFFERDQKDIFDNGYAFNTSMVTLLNAYRKTGNGIIKTTVRCDNEFERDYIKNISTDISTIIQPRSKVETDKYGRIIVGHYSSALEYNFEEPKSILILNYRENFDSEDSTLLNPELVIRLGDIHSIEIVSAFSSINN